MEFDRQNGNNLWCESEEKELSQIDEYNTFLDKGIGYIKPGPGFKKITVHIVYACKHDGRLQEPPSCWWTLDGHTYRLCLLQCCQSQRHLTSDLHR